MNDDFDDDDFDPSEMEANDPYRSPLLEPLEQRLGLPGGTYLGLVFEQSDWVLIGKLGLIVEAALTSFLVLELNKPETYEHISTLSQAQRLKLARTLGILTKDDHSVLQLLASVRNSFVHNLENFRKSLDEHFVGLSAQRRREIAVVLLGSEEVKAKEARNEDGGTIFPHTFKLLLMRQVVLPLITMSARHNDRVQREERAAWEAATPVKAMFKFMFPENPALTIGPSPDGKPGPGISR